MITPTGTLYIYASTRFEFLEDETKFNQNSEKYFEYRDFLRDHDKSPYEMYTNVDCTLEIEIINNKLELMNIEIIVGENKSQFNFQGENDVILTFQSFVDTL